MGNSLSYYFCDDSHSNDNAREKMDAILARLNETTDIHRGLPTGVARHVAYLVPDGERISDADLDQVFNRYGVSIDASRQQILAEMIQAGTLVMEKKKARQSYTAETVPVYYMPKHVKIDYERELRRHSGQSKSMTSDPSPTYEKVAPEKAMIFLSHKGDDKALVRRFFTALTTIGFRPWLDEEAMIAGTELERGILHGFENSCAAVFFITPEFGDEGFLATEVNYAIAQKRSKRDRFAIIVIRFANDAGTKGEVPKLLGQQFVWKEPSTELEALTEIVRALPIKSSGLGWSK
jgi:hypothetical protein